MEKGEPDKIIMRSIAKDISKSALERATGVSRSKIIRIAT